MSQGQIMAYQAPRAAIQGIVEALQAAHVYYGIKQAKAISDHLAESQDPKSEYSQSQQKYEGAMLDVLHSQKGIDGKPLLDDQNYQNLKAEIPKHSGQDIAQLTDSSGLLKIALGNLSAQGMASRASAFGDRNSVQISKDYEQAMTPFRKTQQDIAQIESALSTKDKNGNPLITAQQIGDANQAIARVFSPGHMSDATVNRTEYESIPAQFAAAVQKLSAQPTDAGSRDLINHIIDQAHHIGNVANQNALKELDSLDAGYTSLQNPSSVAMATNKSKAFRDRFGMTYPEAGAGVNPGQQNTAASGFSPIPGTNVQAGDMVDVVSPEGIPGRIPKSNLDKATQRGFRIR